MALTTQKALVVPEPKQPWKLVNDWPVLTPGAKDVVVKIVAAALNPADWKIQVYGHPNLTTYPFVSGFDGAGIVEEVGSSVKDVSKGDRVLFGGGSNPQRATFQQYNVVPEDNVAKIPDNISFDQAASIPLGLATVVTGIWSHHPEASSVNFAAPWEEGGLTKYAGQAALILGGSSCVGQYAIQMAKLQGFAPIITTASPAHTDYLKSLGATHVVDRARSPAEILTELRTITAGKPIAYAYDAVPTPELQHLAYDALAPGGALVMTDWRHPLAFQEKLERDRAAGVVPKRIGRPLGMLDIPGNKTVGVELYKRLTEWLRTGAVVPNRIEVLPGGLAGIPEGCARMRDGRVSGMKLIVHPQETA